MTRIDDIAARLRRHYAELARSGDPALGELQARASAAPPPRSLAEALSIDELALIVEPKRATSARGTINPDLDVAALAEECEAAGASAISVVTEPELSHGTVADLVAARGACDLPLIARDVVVDVRQVLELRAAGADALLVPMEAHVDRDDDSDEDAEGGPPDSSSLAAIIDAAHRLGMDVVLSVCGEEELEAALEHDADALNIDNRDDRGAVDVERTFELLAAVPVGWPVISESVASASEVAKLHKAGVDALLLDEGHLDIGLTNALAVFADLTLDG